MIAEVSSGQKDSIYLDRVGLMSIPQLFNDFKTYEKFFGHKFSLEFVPNQPVTVGGNMTMAPDYDPIDPMPDTMASMSASFNFVRKAITQKTVCIMPNFKLPDGGYMRPSCYCGPGDNDRLVSFGKFMYEATSSLADGIALGSLILHWDITFSVKQPKETSVVVAQTLDKAIKFTCDSAGTVVANSVVNTTKLDEIELWDIAHGASTAMDNRTVYSGIITSLDSCTVHTSTGASVNPGTRVWFKGPRSICNGTTVSPAVANNASIGELSLSRTFDTLMALAVTRSVDAFINLTKIKYFSGF